jgi:hypothetical protein
LTHEPRGSRKAVKNKTSGYADDEHNEKAYNRIDGAHGLVSSYKSVETIIRAVEKRGEFPRPTKMALVA